MLFYSGGHQTSISDYTAIVLEIKDESSKGNGQSDICDGEEEWIIA